VSCAAALAVLDTIERDGLLDSVRTVGDRLAAGLAGISSPLVKGVRGSGLWRALVLTRPVAAQVEAAARAAGVLVNAVQPDAVRVAPPLILSAAEADEAVAALATAVAGVERAATVGASNASVDDGTS
jgi:acetylornithine aminotransferase